MAIVDSASFMLPSKPTAKSTVALTPIESAILAATQNNSINGNGNLGFLSLEAGLLPSAVPTALPTTHKAWDDIAADFPALWKSGLLEERMAGLPLLCANRKSLSDEHLHRAAAILGCLAHAVTRLSLGGVPAQVQKPWEEVCLRLARPAPFLSFMDLIVFHWRYVGSGHGHFGVIDLDIQSSMKTDDCIDQLYYLTSLISVDLLKRVTPLIHDIINAQKAIVGHNSKMLAESLGNMIQHIDNLRPIISKITPKTGHNDVYGPAAAASPVLHMLEDFLNIKPYATMLAEENIDTRTAYPAHWRSFIHATGSINLAQYISKAACPQLASLYIKVQEAYCGKSGILGVYMDRAGVDTKTIEGGKTAIIIEAPELDNAPEDHDEIELESLIPEEEVKHIARRSSRVASAVNNNSPSSRRRSSASFGGFSNRRRSSLIQVVG